MIRQIRQLSLYVPSAEDYYYVANDGTIFRRLVAYDGCYAFSDNGKHTHITKQVKSAKEELKRNGQRFVQISNRIYVLSSGEVLRTCATYVNDEGYYEYCFNNILGGKTKKRVHQLVAQCFMEVPEGSVVHHIDRNKFNNDVSNLEILTRQEHQNEHFYEGEMSNPPHEFTYRRVVITNGIHDIEILGSIKEFCENSSIFHQTPMYRLLRGETYQYKGYSVKLIEYNTSSETTESTEV